MTTFEYFADPPKISLPSMSTNVKAPMLTLACEDILGNFLINVTQYNGTLCVKTVAKREDYGSIVIITIKSANPRKTLYKSVLKIRHLSETKIVKSLCEFSQKLCEELYSEFWRTDNNLI